MRDTLILIWAIAIGLMLVASAALVNILAELEFSRAMKSVGTHRRKRWEALGRI